VPSKVGKRVDGQWQMDTQIDRERDTHTHTLLIYIHTTKHTLKAFFSVHTFEECRMRMLIVNVYFVDCL